MHFIPELRQESCFASTPLDGDGSQPDSTAELEPLDLVRNDWKNFNLDLLTPPDEPCTRGRSCVETLGFWLRGGFFCGSVEATRAGGLAGLPGESLGVCAVQFCSRLRILKLPESVSFESSVLAGARTEPLAGSANDCCMALLVPARSPIRVPFDLEELVT